MNTMLTFDKKPPCYYNGAILVSDGWGRVAFSLPCVRRGRSIGWRRHESEGLRAVIFPNPMARRQGKTAPMCRQRIRFRTKHRRESPHNRIGGSRSTLPRSRSTPTPPRITELSVRRGRVASRPRRPRRKAGSVRTGRRTEGQTRHFSTCG